MFYVLSKTLDLAIEPIAWAIALVAIGVFVAPRHPRVTRATGLAALALLVVLSTPRFSLYLMGLVERDAPRTYDATARYDAVILLTGFAETVPSHYTGRLQLNGAAERLIASWDVFHTGHARNIFISGNDEDELTRAELVAWGAPRDRVLFEDISLNTHQNAVEANKAVQKHGWRRLLLVTSAFHMERALGCFRRVGLEPDALPVDYRGADGRVGELLPREDAFYRSATALRELAGRVVYRAIGYSE